MCFLLTEHSAIKRVTALNIVVANITARPFAEFAPPDKPLARFWACVMFAALLIVLLVLCVFVVIYKLAIRDIKMGRADPVTTQKYRHSKVRGDLVSTFEQNKKAKLQALLRSLISTVRSIIG